MGEPVTYADLHTGDVIEVRIDAPLFPQIDGDWERRTVVAVHWPRITFDEDGREYTIDAEDSKKGRESLRRLAASPDGQERA